MGCCYQFNNSYGIFKVKSLKNLKNAFKYAWNGIANFSVKPLKIATGIVGEYISKMYLEIKSRPIYVAKNTLGFDDDIL